MLVELSKSGLIINKTRGEVLIKLETGDVITKDESLLSFPVSLGDNVNVFNNNFLIAGENPQAKEQYHE